MPGPLVRGIDATGHEVIGYEDELVQEVGANESGTKGKISLSSILELEKTIKSEPDFDSFMGWAR